MIEPVPSAVKVQSLNHSPAREFPIYLFFIVIYFDFEIFSFFF